MHIRGDHSELVVGGRLDVRSAADARTVLHSAVDDGAGDLVLDLTGLDSWDATGLGVIMGAHRRAGRCGRRLVLRGVPPQMQRLLVATRLHRILAIEGGLAAESLPASEPRSGARPVRARRARSPSGKAHAVPPGLAGPYRSAAHAPPYSPRTPAAEGGPTAHAGAKRPGRPRSPMVTGP